MVDRDRTLTAASKKLNAASTSDSCSAVDICDCNFSGHTLTKGAYVVKLVFVGSSVNRISRSSAQDEAVRLSALKFSFVLAALGDGREKGVERYYAGLYL